MVGGVTYCKEAKQPLQPPRPPQPQGGSKSVSQASRRKWEPRPFCPQCALLLSSTASIRRLPLRPRICCRCPVRAGAASARRTRAAAQAARGVTKRTSSKSQERLQRLPLLLCGAAVALLEAAVAVCEYVLWRLHSGEADVQGGRETLIVVDVNTLCPECMYYSYYIAYILVLYCSSKASLPQML